MTTHQFEENCEILEGICEEYGLKLRIQRRESYHYTELIASVFASPRSRYMHFCENSLSNPNWDSIRERVCSLSLENSFS